MARSVNDLETVEAPYQRTGIYDTTTPTSTERLTCPHDSPFCSALQVS